MKFRIDKTLRFWADVAYEHIKPAHHNLTKRQVVAQILRKYEQRGDAMRYLDVEEKIAWKATPRFLTMLAEPNAMLRDELEDVS